MVKLNGYIFQHISLSENGVASVLLNVTFWSHSKQQRSKPHSLLGHLEILQGLRHGSFVEENDQIRVRFRSKGVVINTIAKNIMAEVTRLQPVRPYMIGQLQMRFCVI